MRPVRARGVNLADQRYGAQHVPLRIPLVGATVHERQGHASGGSAEQHNGRHRQPLIDLAGEFDVSAARVRILAEFHGNEQEALGVARAERVGVE